MITRSIRAWGLLAGVLALCLGACSPSGPTSRSASTLDADVAPASGDQSSRLVLSAAASTKEVIESLVKGFRVETGIEVRVNLGSSSTLANQISAGAPVDLFLSANQQWADEVEKTGKVKAMTRLLTNQLVIVVPAGNPAGVQQPSDLLKPEVKRIALAGEKVPAGIYADQALSRSGLLDQLVADGKIVRGQDVRSALSYVERGEAEAGIVYSTDVLTVSGIQVVHALDPKLHDEIVYVLALLKGESDEPTAKKLYEYLQSPEAERTYDRFGFSRLR